MKNLLPVILLVAALSSSALGQDPTDPDLDTSIPTPVEIGSSILTSLLESGAITNSVNRIVDVIDLKLRFFQLIKSLITRENLILLRRLLELVGDKSHVLASILPERPQLQQSGILRAIFPMTADQQTNASEQEQAVEEATVAAPRVSRRIFEHEGYETGHEEAVRNLDKLIYGPNK